MLDERQAEKLKKALAASACLNTPAVAELPWVQVRVKSGDTLTDVWQDKPCVCLVAAGRVDAYAVAVDGNDTLLNSLELGDCFGISNLLQEDPLQTRLVCVREATVFVCPKKALLDLMTRDGALAMRYAQLLNDKIALLLGRIELLTAQSCRSKLIAYLLLHRNADGQISLTCSRDELASRLDISRAALFRELASLTKDGLLTTKGSRIVVSDAEALAALL